MKNTNTAITKYEQKIIRATAMIKHNLAVIDGVEYDTIGGCYEPARLDGVWSPDEADRTVRHAQHNVFTIMEAIGKPLIGWHQYDAFVSSFAEYGKIKRAWKIARQEHPQYCGCIVSGDGTMENPFILEVR
jgi:hypothetical protein